MTIAPLLVAMTIAAQAKSAQTSRFQPYVFGSGGLSIHPGTGAEYFRVPDRLNGHTWTVGGGGGVFLTPSFGLEGEFVFAGEVRAPQEFHYSTTTSYVVHNRDILINELVRFRAGGRAALQIVGGGGLAHTTSRNTSTVFFDTFTGRRTNVPDSPTWSYNGLTLTGGLDAAVRLGDRATLAPTVRVRWLHRPPADGLGWNGIGNLALQVGAAVFFR